MSNRKKSSKFTEHTSFFSSSIDNEKIFYRKHIPSDEKVQRVVIYQHGFGEHSGRYNNLVQTMAGSGTALYGIDSRGHGRSPGIRGHVEDFDWYCRDFGQLVGLALEETNLKQAIVLGHSMGGVIVLKYALAGENQKRIAGLISSSTGFSPVLDFEKTVKKTAASILSAFLPGLVLDANLDVNLLSHDPQVIADYQSDPLVHGKISLKMGDTFFSSGTELLRRAHLLTVPLLVIHGTADGITDAKSSREFYERAASKDKTLKLYEGLYHETMNEASPDRERVLADIKDWILQH